MGGRIMIVFIMRSGMRWSATMPGPDVEKIASLQRRTGADDGNTGGRPKCMSGRQHRTNGVSVGSSDAPWDMEQAAKPMRVRNAGDTCVLWPVRLTPDLARLPHGSGLPALTCGRRGRGVSPSRSARPLGIGKATEDRRALEPDEPWGDDARPGVARCGLLPNACRAV